MEQRIGFESPVGYLVVREEDGAIVAIDWAQASCPAPTSDSALLREARRQLDGYFARTRTAFDLPLNPRGTAFQKRVWQAMSAIPYGETITYGELARRIGSVPRAIGGACGANPIPVIVPCHRVVAANGAPGGYSGQGGLDTKARLLAIETARG